MFYLFKKQNNLTWFKLVIFPLENKKLKKLWIFLTEFCVGFLVGFSPADPEAGHDYKIVIDRISNLPNTRSVVNPQTCLLFCLFIYFFGNVNNMVFL